MSTTELEPEGEGAPESVESMGIDPYEKNWMRFSVAMLVVFCAIVAIGGFAMGFAVPGDDGEIDPRTAFNEGRWAEPGLRQLDEGVYEAYVIAQSWVFTPRELEVPVGSEVTIYVSSPDLQHGFYLSDTNVNMMVVPGQVSKLTYTFDEVGEFQYICNEYCGSGHAAMFGVVNVVPATQASDDGAEGAQ